MNEILIVFICMYQQNLIFSLLISSIYHRHVQINNQIALTFTKYLVLTFNQQQLIIINV